MDNIKKALAFSLSFLYLSLNSVKFPVNDGVELALTSLRIIFIFKRSYVVICKRFFDYMIFLHCCQVKTYQTR